jgi:hypothetical protein
VGSFTIGTTSQNLIERWDGGSWSIVPSPNTSPSEDNLLNDVDCVSGVDCTAVGVSGNSVTQTLILRWAGSAWSITTSPDTGPNDQNYLSAITCAPTADCWTVGFYQPDLFSQTLIEKRTLPILNFSSVSVPTTGMSAGHFIISGKAVPNSMVNVYTTQFLGSTFFSLGSTTADSNGNFQYDDAGAVLLNPSMRYYEIQYP